MRRRRLPQRAWHPSRGRRSGERATPRTVSCRGGKRRARQHCCCARPSRAPFHVENGHGALGTRPKGNIPADSSHVARRPTPGTKPLPGDASHAACRTMPGAAAVGCAHGPRGRRPDDTSHVTRRCTSDTTAAALRTRPAGHCPDDASHVAHRSTPETAAARFETGPGDASHAARRSRHGMPEGAQKSALRAMPG